MAESSYLMSKARDILATPSDEGLAMLVDHLSMPQESNEYKSARALYNFCVSHFPNCLTLKLLMVYRFSSNDITRLQSIYLLSVTLTELKAQRFKLSLVTLQEIKPLLISCLKMENTRKCDIEFLSNIVSFVADHGRWEELSDYILSLVNSNPIRAFEFFIDLPSLYGEFPYRFPEKFLVEVYKVLLYPENDRVEDWILALKAAVKMGIELMNSEMSFDLTRDILHIVLKCADEIVRNGMEEEFLQRGLQSLEKSLVKDADLCKWNSDQCSFVEEFAFMISGIGPKTKEAAKKIYQMVIKLEKYVHNPAFRLSPSRVVNQDLSVDSEIEFCNNLMALSSLEIMGMVASTQMDDWYREVALIRLHNLLCDHTLGKAELDVSEIRELQPLLTSCLSEIGVPESTFKILGQVVFHVAHEDNWFEIWDYIARECKTEFKKTVYIFQCLSMRIDDKEFVIHALDKLLPEIYSRLNPPREVLVDDKSCWVLAFTGAFCAGIHLIEISSHTESAKEILYKMIDSVTELVKRGMEAELVNRALTGIESILEKQFDTYTTNGYRFVKGLVLRLNTIKGMSMESQTVLWRIYEILERVQEVKVLPKSELDWMNQPETQS